MIPKKIRLHSAFIFAIFIGQKCEIRGIYAGSVNT